MIRTKEQQAEDRRQPTALRGIEGGGAGPCAAALPPPTPRDGAPSPRSRSSTGRPFPAAGTGRRGSTRRGAAHRQHRRRIRRRSAGLERGRYQRAAQSCGYRQGAVGDQPAQGPRHLLRHGPRAVQIMEDTTGGAHDALAGGSTAATNAARYHGDDPSQHARQFRSRRRQARP